MTNPVARPGSLAARLSTTRRVLGIEDEPDIAEFLRAYFRASGYDFVHRDPASIKEGVAAVEELSPDCVLLDMNLRGFSGLEIYRRLRTKAALALTPVIVVTANVTLRPQTAGTAAGIDGFVEKPFNVNTLAALVGERIDAARRLADDAGADDGSGVLSAPILAARLADGILHARAAGGPLAFGLVSFRALTSLRKQLGDEGLGWLRRQLAADARAALPEEVAVARTDTGELAVLAPDQHPEALAALVHRVLAAVRGRRQVPGGVEVRYEPLAGIAGFPTHATDADGLYMAADAALADAHDGTDAVAVAL